MSLSGDDFYSVRSNMSDNFQSMESINKKCENNEDKLVDIFQRIGNLQDTRYDATYNISQLKQRIVDIEKQELELMKESTIHHSQLQGYYASDGDEDSYIMNLTRDEAQRLECMQHELKMLNDQVQSEQEKLEELEEQLEKITTRMYESKERDSKDHLQQQRIIVEEQRDQQSKIFEDLEFKELETQSRFEEESELMKRHIIEAQRQRIVSSRNRENKKLLLDEQQINLMKDTRRTLDKLESERTYCTQQITYFQHILNNCNKKIDELNRRLDYGRGADQSLALIEHNGNYHANDDTYAILSEFSSHMNAEKQSEVSLIADELSFNSKAAIAAHNDSLHNKLESLTEIVRMNLSIHSKSDINHCPSLFTKKSDRDSFEIFQRQQIISYPSTISLSDDSSSMTQTDSAICLDRKATVTFESDVSASSNQSNNSESRRQGSSSDLMPGISNNDENCRPDQTSTVITRKTDKSTNRRNKQWRPLTCFLPKMNSDFNLRHHIESCGHDLTVCGQHIQLDRNSCQGFMWKLSNRMFGVYRKRWFYFDQNQRELRYYTSKSMGKLKGTISFQNISDVFVDHTHRVKSPQKLSFCIETPIKTFYLITSKLELVTLWIDVIFTGAEAYLSLHPPPTISHILSSGSD